MEERIDLEAVLPDQNVSRFYSIFIHKDLFGDFCVTTSNGRIGKSGRFRSYHFECIDDALKKRDAVLQRRFNAKKRIGVNYRVVSAEEKKQTF